MDFAHYAAGTVVLAVALVPIAAGAHLIRARWLPDATGGTGLLADAVVVLAVVLGVCELLGAAGRFRAWSVISGCVLAGSAMIAVAGRVPAPAEPEARREPVAIERPYYDRRVRAVTIVVVAITVIIWLRRAARGSGGILDFDSLNYHLPFAARFLQTGHTLGFHYITPGLETPFDPANSELLVAFFMLPFHRDVVAPVLNIAWMALAFLAAWCIGRPRGVGDLTLVGACLVIASPLMVEHDAGSASNDIVMLALLLTTFAFLVEARGRPRWIVMAAIAAGLGLGTKLTLLVPTAILTVAVIVVASRGKRARTAAAWLIPLIVTGGYWYLRDLVKIGNPVPSVDVGVGPIRLPAPHLSVVDRQGFTIANYITDTHVWHKYFVWGLRHDFGQIWPLVVAISIVGMVVAAIHGDRMTRVIGAVALISFAAYIITPTSAGGQKNAPLLFTPNVRFAFPALTLGAIGFVLVCARAQRPVVLRACFGVLVVAFACEHGWAAIPVVLALAAGAWLLASVRIPAPRVSRRVLAAGGVVVVVLGVVAGFALQKHYLEQRFRSVTPMDPKISAADTQALNALYQWSRLVSNSRIAVAGVEAVYPLYGIDLTNRVQYIGQHSAHGTFERSTSCAQWRRQVNDGAYDYIVTGRDSAPGAEPHASWARGPATDLLFERGSISVFRVKGPLDPAGCPA